jgi:hypothetical protein
MTTFAFRYVSYLLYGWKQALPYTVKPMCHTCVCSLMHIKKYSMVLVGWRDSMCPHTNFLWPLVPKIVPGDTMSLHWNIPVIIQYTIRIKMLNDRDVWMRGHSVSGTIHLGDQGSKKICKGTHRFRTFRHPTMFFNTNTLSSYTKRWTFSLFYFNQGMHSVNFAQQEKNYKSSLQVHSIKQMYAVFTVAQLKDMFLVVVHTL